MKSKSLLVILSVALLAGTFTLSVKADQPRMQEAKASLENALKSLKKATADKGGHREQAMDLTSQAISSVNKGIEYDRTHYTPRHNHVFNMERSLSLSASPDQPNMVTARNYLTAAIGSLNKASADKGGYREEALRLVRAAIAEVDAGIEYDRTH